jgi:HEAT repeat protein
VHDEGCGPGRSAAERANALAALRNLAQDDADTQALIAETGGIPPLVAHIASGDDAHKAFAAGVLWHLSATAEHQVAIAKAGGIPPLVALARDGNEVQRENATGALMKLAETRANQSLIAKAGGIAVLLACITDESSTEAVIAPPSSSESVMDTKVVPKASAKTIRASGEGSPDIPVLLQFLKRGSRGDKATVLSRLSRWAGSNDKGQAILRAGGIPTLLDCLRDEREHSDVKTSVARTLRSLASIRAVQTEIGTRGGAKPLIALVQHGNDSQQAAAAGALGRIALCPESSTAILEAHGVPALVALLGSSDDDAKLQSVTALRNLAIGKCQRSAIVEAGGIPLLVSLLEGGTSVQRTQAAKVLWCLAVTPFNRSAITAAGGVRLLEKMVQSEEYEQKASATSALGRLLSTSRGDTTDGDIPALIKQVCDGSAKEKAKAVATLRELAPDDSSNVIATSGGIPAMFDLIERGPTDVKTDALAVLEKLVSMHGNAAFATAGHHVSTLLRELRSGLNEHRTLVIRALRSIFLQSRRIVGLSENAVAVHLVELLRAGNNEQKRLTAATMLHLASTQVYQSEIGVAGAIWPLIKLGSHQDDIMRSDAVSVLCKLTLWPKNRIPIAEADGIRLLVASVRDANDLEKVEIVHALWCLVTTLKKHAAAKKLGIVSALITVVRHSTGPTRTSAGNLLQDMSEHPSTRRLVADAGGYRALEEWQQSIDMHRQATKRKRDD